MPHRNWKVRIDNMLEAIAEILEFTESMSLPDFVADRRTLRAVERGFEIIGEAARHVPPDVESRYPLVPWARMRGMRNVVIHDYSTVDPAVLWDTAQRELPPLIPLLQEILEKEP